MGKTLAPKGETRAKIAELLDQGVSEREMMEKLGITSKSTVNWHKRKIREEENSDGNLSKDIRPRKPSNIEEQLETAKLAGYLGCKIVLQLQVDARRDRLPYATLAKQVADVISRSADDQDR